MASTLNESANALTASRNERGSARSVTEYLRQREVDAANLRADQIPARLDQLRAWQFDQSSGTIRHDRGGFFSVAGIRVGQIWAGQVAEWDQPVFIQPEVGILGIVVRYVDGALQILLQNKVEPGNINGIQLSPTVQATRSNFTRVHGGGLPPYLQLFVNPRRVLVDITLAEYGSWFLRKRNRNVVVIADPDIPVLPRYRWMTVGDVAELLAVENLVNSATRSVLSSLFAAAYQPSVQSAPRLPSTLRSRIRDHSRQSRTRISRKRIDELDSWRLSTWELSHRDGGSFKVVGVEVCATGREVDSWDQPMIVAERESMVGLLTRIRHGKLEALMRVCVSPGSVNGGELCATVHVSGGVQHPDLQRLGTSHLPTIKSAPATDILFDYTLPEDGGRFLNMECRYVGVYVDEAPTMPGQMWVELNEINMLIGNAGAVSVQARTALLCLQMCGNPKIHELIGGRV